MRFSFRSGILLFIYFLLVPFFFCTISLSLSTRTFVPFPLQSSLGTRGYTCNVGSHSLEKQVLLASLRKIRTELCFLHISTRKLRSVLTPLPPFPFNSLQNRISILVSLLSLPSSLTFSSSVLFIFTHHSPPSYYVGPAWPNVYKILAIFH